MLFLSTLAFHKLSLMTIHLSFIIVIKDNSFVINDKYPYHLSLIKFRIQFKVLLLVYKALNGLAPKYIKELLVPYKPRRHLRSEAKGLLDEPRTRLKFGDRAFSISAPRLWNALPQHLKDSTSCQAFKKCLKTHLFRLAH